MAEYTLIHLNLRAPLKYTEVAGQIPFVCPFPGDETGPEIIFCYELDHEQAGSIDPQADSFLGRLVFSGKMDNEYGEFQLPAGLYLFSQQKKALNRDECIAMAIEQQKDGLWERLKLGKRLYIRCLYEDNSPVVQLFRPYN